MMLVRQHFKEPSHHGPQQEHQAEQADYPVSNHPGDHQRDAKRQDHGPRGWHRKHDAVRTFGV